MGSTIGQISKNFRTLKISNWGASIKIVFFVRTEDDKTPILKAEQWVNILDDLGQKYPIGTLWYTYLSDKQV